MQPKETADVAQPEANPFETSGDARKWKLIAFLALFLSAASVVASAFTLLRDPLKGRSDLILVDEDGTPRIHLTAAAELPRIELLDDAGKAQVVVAVGDPHSDALEDSPLRLFVAEDRVPSLVLTGPGEIGSVGLGVTTGSALAGPTLNLSGGAGRIAMTVGQAGPVALSLNALGPSVLISADGAADSSKVHVGHDMHRIELDQFGPAAELEVLGGLDADSSAKLRADEYGGRLQFDERRVMDRNGDRER